MVFFSLIPRLKSWESWPSLVRTQLGSPSPFFINLHVEYTMCVNKERRRRAWVRKDIGLQLL